MISASAEYKALWHQKHGVIEKIRIRYKRRYYNGSSFVYETTGGPDNDGWHTLEQGEFAGVGSQPMSLDTPFQNIFNNSIVTLRLDNSGNQVRQYDGGGLFAADSVATNGYKLYKTKFQIQVGYQLSSGSMEWLSVFTGLALRAKHSSKQNVATVEVSSNGLLLEKSDAEDVSDTFTLENCSPATGDGSRTTFETTSLGVDHITDVQVNAVSMTQGTDWTVSNTLAVVGPANTGKALLTFASAPGNTLTVKCSGVKWKQNESLNTLIGLLCDACGITSAGRSVDTILLPGTSGSQTLDTKTQWEANTPSFTNVSSTALEGSLVRQWFLIDDFTDGDFTASPVWDYDVASTPSIASDGTQTNYLSQPQPGGAIQVVARTPFTKTTGTWRWRTYVAAGGIARYYFFSILYGSVGYCVEINTNTGLLKLIKNYPVSGIGSPPPPDTVLINTGGFGTAATWQTVSVTRDSSGNFELFVGGVSRGTATDTTVTINNYFSLSNEPGSTGAARIDDIHWRPDTNLGASSPSTATSVYICGEIDLLAAPTAWGTLAATEVLNSGTITYETSVSTTSGAGYDAYVAVTNGGVIGSALKRYLKIRVTITPASGSYDSPELQKIIAGFTTSTIFVSLANFAGKKCKGAVERLIQIADYQMRFDGAGTFKVTSKDANETPAAEISQENGIIEITDYQDGIDEVVNVGRVRSGTDGRYFSEYKGSTAGEASPTSESEYGKIVRNDDFTDVLLANDINLSVVRARKIYENNYLPKPKIRAKIWNIPWLEVGDTLRVDFFDNPKMKDVQASDELSKVDDFANAGAPGSIISNQEDWRVLTYNPNWDTGIGEVYMEKIL